MYITQMFAHTRTCAHIYSTYTKEGGGAFTQKQCFRNKSLGIGINRKSLGRYRHPEPEPFKSLWQGETSNFIVT